MKKKLILTAVLIMFLISINAAFSKDAANLTGEAFKEVDASAWLNSEPLKVADQKGKTVLLEFWATWCPPCKKSIPHLIELYNKYKDKNVVFMAFTDEAKETAEPFVKEMKMPYPIGVGSKSANDYGVSGIPHAVIIGPDQKIAWAGHPMDPEFEKNLEKAASASTGAAKTEAAATSAVTGEVKVEAAPVTGEVKAAPAAGDAGAKPADDCGTGK